MQVIHPQTAYHGIPPENVFLAVDELGAQAGIGYIIYQYQEHLYPDCPINMYFSIDSQPAGRYLLFGALVARARQLRDSNPEVHARFYTGIAPEDTAAREFYQHNGMSCEDTENDMRLSMAVGDGRVPMGCAAEPTPLNTPDEIQAFVKRMQDNDIAYMDANYLYQLMRQPHFHAVGLFSGNTLVGEAVLAGVNDSCSLEAIYIMPGYRRQGLGKALLARCMAVMAAEGVTGCTTRFITRSVPQQGLARAFGAADLGATMVFPCLYL